MSRKTLSDSFLNAGATVLNGFANRYELDLQEKQQVKKNEHEINLAQTKADYDFINKQTDREHDLKIVELKNEQSSKSVKKEPTAQEKANTEQARIYNEALAKKDDGTTIFDNMLSAQIEIGKGSADPTISKMYINVEKMGSHNISIKQAKSMSKENLQIHYNNLLEMEKLGIPMDQNYKNRIQYQLDLPPKKGLFGWGN